MGFAAKAAPREGNGPPIIRVPGVSTELAMNANASRSAPSGARETFGFTGQRMVTSKLIRRFQ